MTELLSREEELELGTKIQKMVAFEEDPEAFSDDDAEEILYEGKSAVATMVEKNLGLVHSAAQNFRTHYTSNLEYDDVVQDGMIGLMNAIYKFDPTRGNKFSTLASWWIFQSINRNTNNYSRIVRLPENRIIQYGKILEIQNRYEEDSTITQAEIDEIILEEVKISSKTLDIIRKTMASPASLNKVITNDNSTGTRELIDFIDDEDEERLEDTVVKNELYKILQSVLEKLDQKERDLLSASFAISGLTEDVLSQTEIRSKYRLSRQRYNTLLEKTLDKVESEMNSLGLSFSDFT